MDNATDQGLNCLVQYIDCHSELYKYSFQEMSPIAVFRAQQSTTGSRHGMGPRICYDQQIRWCIRQRNDLQSIFEHLIRYVSLAEDLEKLEHGLIESPHSC